MLNANTSNQAQWEFKLRYGDRRVEIQEGFSKLRVPAKSLSGSTRLQGLDHVANLICKTWPWRKGRDAPIKKSRQERRLLVATNSYICLPLIVIQSNCQIF
jgi:hypothetical protein